MSQTSHPDLPLDLSLLHPILKLREVIAIFRMSESTARRQLARGTFRPLPWDRNPYRWNRDEVIEAVNRRRNDAERRRLHAEAHRPKAAKASIDPTLTRAAR